MNKRLQEIINDASLGYTPAITTLKCAFRYGDESLDVEADPTQEKKWLEKLINNAENNDFCAMEYIASIKQTSDLYSDIVAVYGNTYSSNLQSVYRQRIKEAANAGNSDAIYANACLKYGHVSYGTAATNASTEWKKETFYAAEHGSPWACFQLYNIYLQDYKSTPTAIKFLKLGAEYSGIYAANCQYMLGLIYRDGDSVLPRNTEQYVYWMKKAISNGSLEAKNTLQRTHNVSGNTSKNEGCYIATAVYGSYDCPQVWTLRRFRDNILRKNIFGKILVTLYYTISPTLVKLFGGNTYIKKYTKYHLDAFVQKLNVKGIDNKPYRDKNISSNSVN